MTFARYKSSLGIRMFQQSKITTASLQYLNNKTFRIIHPFHPSVNKEFEFHSIKTPHGERRVYYYNSEGCIASVPLEWTDIELPDPFIIVSAGRALFRIKDILRLVYLIDEIKKAGGK